MLMQPTWRNLRGKGFPLGRIGEVWRETKRKRLVNETKENAQAIAVGSGRKTGSGARAERSGGCLEDVNKTKNENAFLDAGKTMTNFVENKF